MRKQSLWKNWRVEEGIFLTSERIQQIQQIIKECESNTLTDNSSLYFSKQSEIPRYKLKAYLEEKSLVTQKVRKIEEADIAIVNKKSLQNIGEYIYKYGLSTLTTLPECEQEYYYIDPSSLSPDSLLRYAANNNKWADIHYIKTDIKNISERLYVVEEYTDPHFQSKFLKEIHSLPTVKGFVLTKQWGNTKLYDNIEQLFDIFDEYFKGNIQIVFDESLNNDINEGLSLDDTMMENSIDMILSGDSDNIYLAKEMIANCDIEVSKAYMILLMHLFPVFSVKGNNPNFKILVNSLSQYRKYYKIETLQEFLVEIMKDHPELIKDIMKGLNIYLNRKSKTNIL